MRTLKIFLLIVLAGACTACSSSTIEKPTEINEVSESIKAYEELGRESSMRGLSRDIFILVPDATSSGELLEAALEVYKTEHAAMHGNGFMLVVRAWSERRWFDENVSPEVQVAGTRNAEDGLLPATPEVDRVCWRDQSKRPPEAEIAICLEYEREMLAADEALKPLLKTDQAAWSAALEAVKHEIDERLALKHEFENLGDYFTAKVRAASWLHHLNYSEEEIQREAAKDLRHWHETK